MPESPQPFPRVTPITDPPAVKVINAWAGLGALLISHVLEIVVCTYAWQALMGDKLTSHEFSLIVGFCVVGPAFAKARGKLSSGALGMVLIGGSNALSNAEGSVGQAARTVRDSLL